MQEFVNRETTLREEIEDLGVPQSLKDRLLRKLDEMQAGFDRQLCEATWKREKMATEDHEKYNRIREQNISLKNACFALAAAVKQEYEL